eukprot:CAMPEP_0194050484 /NCGR_PEP_ID=MMETSP0009_2-20130614/35567_1 /TAXON_ID=210454 /ORGANISM="Grammatophora oceanica, Strain CCMP 410" /LENGTH=48 /DNA_ID= /DNA_START= /DNA_END= /DNA_ORIENTATION=
MTWLEEVVLWLEFTWGRTHVRLEDYVAQYGCDKKGFKNGNMLQTKDGA